MSYVITWIKGPNVSSPLDQNPSSKLSRTFAVDFLFFTLTFYLLYFSIFPSFSFLSHFFGVSVSVCTVTATVYMWRSEKIVRCRSSPSILFEARSLVHVCTHQINLQKIPLAQPPFSPSVPGCWWPSDFYVGTQACTASTLTTEPLSQMGR